MSKLSAQAFIAGNKRFKVISGEACDFQPLPRMQEKLENIGEVSEADIFLAQNADYAKKLKAANEVVSSLVKSSSDLKSHLTTNKSERNRATKRKADEQQKDAIKKAREEVTAAVVAIKKNKTKRANM